MRDLHVAMTGWQACPPTWTWQRSAASQRWYDLWVVVAGSGTVVVRGQRRPLRAGDVLVYPPGLACAATQDPHQRLTVGYAWFSCTDDSALRARIGREPCAHHAAAQPNFLAELMRRCHAADQPETRSLWLAAALADAASPTAPADLVDGRIHALCQRILAEPARRWSLAGLAAAAGLSPAQCARRFRIATGASPVAYLIRNRIAQAQHLLTFGGASIAATAQALGYPDVPTFAKQFTSITGAPPAAWRRARAGDG
jgi:AraC-like DNA-binding protein